MQQRRPEAFILITRADDMGYTHTGNLATIECLRNGIIRCAGVLVIAPWFGEAAQLTCENPDLCFGVHLHMIVVPEPEVVIECRGVSYHLEGGRALLSDLNLQIRRGETLVLLGRSGSGKTTTLKLINKLLEPTEGQVLVEGRATSAWDPIRLRRRIGYVIQEVGLFPHFTVERNVGLVPSLEGWPAERTCARVRELLDLVGLEAERFAGRFPRELSGGQRQRVGVARALAADPPFLLMDEPFGALDPVTRAEIQREFQTLERRLQKTIVFVTHDLREGLMLATRVALMEGGRLVGVYTPEEFRRASDPAVMAYLQAFETAETTRGGE
jgi:osmoprotectant transport system ATP-binding protein